jgi:hypothetical protein
MSQAENASHGPRRGAHRIWKTWLTSPDDFTILLINPSTERNKL